LVVGVAVAAGGDEVAPAQRKLAAIVIEADERPAVGAMTLAAVEERAPAVRVAVAGAALGVEARHAFDVVAGGAANRLMAPVERKRRLAVIERRHVGELRRRVALRAFTT